jgi:hypothetical protein
MRKAPLFHYTAAVWNLTRQQRRVICVGLFLVLVGWAVKAWRLAHPPARDAVVSAP